MSIQRLLAGLGIGIWLVGASQGAWAAGRDPGKRILVPSNFLKFHYENSEGDFALPCEHAPELSTGNDWALICGKGTKNQKKFSAHVVITKFLSQSNPRSTYQILFWISDDNDHQKTSHFTGSTTWVRFVNDALLHSVLINQSVENDYARIWMEISPPSERR